MSGPGEQVRWVAEGQAAAGDADTVAAGPSERLGPRLGERIRAAAQSRPAMVTAIVLVFLLLWALAEARNVSGERLLSLAVWGVMLGGIIALGSIGLTLVYGVLKFPNFSHGALVTLGAYLAFAFMGVLPQGEPLRPFSFGWEFLLSLLLAMPIVGAVALGLDRVLYQRLRRRSASLVLFAMASL
nr:hypothetical protein [Gammaproteobacteria bacterium]